MLYLGAGMSRCVMIDNSHAGIPDKVKSLRTPGKHQDTEFGLQAHAEGFGALRVGDVPSLVCLIEEVPPVLRETNRSGTDYTASLDVTAC